MFTNIDKDILSLFELHKIRNTPVRKSVLHLFKEKGHALSQPELEEYFKKDFDRVTIYRTLHAFMDKGLVHKVPSEDGVTRYALCMHNHHGSEPHVHEHIHFLCLACRKTFCIEMKTVPKVDLPKGFKKEELSFFAKGYCDACSAD